MSDVRAARWYLDTSVLLRALLGDSPSALAWLNDAFSAGDEFYASYLMETETLRTLRNMHLRDGVEADWTLARMWLDRVHRVEITRAILDDAVLLPAIIRTADAIHLATANALGSLPVLTHDAQMAAAVRALAAQTGRQPQVAFDPVDDDPGAGPVAAAPQ